MKNNKFNIKKHFNDNKGFILFIILMSVFRSAVADWYTVPTGSMQPTIEIGDRITVNKMAYDLRIPFTDISIVRTGEPQHGDIIVFESNAAEQRLIKRVIALPGDTVAMKNDKLIVNGQQSHYRISKETAHDVFVTETIGQLQHSLRFDKVNYSPLHSFEQVTVPKDHYLVLGDNRRNSADSRVYGFVPRSELKGKAKHIAFSLNYDNNYQPRSDRFAQSLYDQQSF